MGIPKFGSPKSTIFELLENIRDEPRGRKEVHYVLNACMKSSKGVQLDSIKTI